MAARLQEIPQPSTISVPGATRREDDGVTVTEDRQEVKVVREVEEEIKNRGSGGGGYTAWSSDERETQGKT